MDSYLPHVGFVQFPSRPVDLTTAVCPACFTPRVPGARVRCGLDLSHPAMAELDAASSDAAAALDRRLETIGRIRYETATAVAAPVALAAVSAGPVPTAIPAPPPPAAAPAPPALPAEPRRHLGVQVILLIVGVSLLAIGAIFFLVFAFITFGLVWRSVIIATVTVAAFVTASLLKRRLLRATAEAISALAVVFVYLDAFAIRANDLFGLGDSDALRYWGLTLIVSAIGLTVWRRLSGLRLPSLVAATAFVPGVALLAAGVTEPLDTELRVFAGFAAATLAGIAFLAVRTLMVERTIVLSFASVGLIGAAITSFVIVPGQDWAPAIAILALTVLAAALAAAILRAGVSRPFALALSGAAAVLASSAVFVAALRISDDAFAMIAPVVAAALVALLLELLLRRLVPGSERTAVLTAAWSAAGVAALILLVPLVTAIGRAVTIASQGFPRWAVPGGTVLGIEPGFAAAVIAIAIVVLLPAAAWGAGGRLGGRRAILVAAGIGTLVLAVPLLGVLWLTVLGWLLLACVLVAGLVVGQSRGWSAGIRASLAAGCGAALTLTYLSSWASIDTWWYGSVGTVLVLVVARTATRRPEARAALLGLAAVLALVAIGSEGWHTNERFAAAQAPELDAAHAVLLLAAILIALSALIVERAVSRVEGVTLFWISFITGAAAVAISVVVGGIPGFADSVVFPHLAASLILGIAALVALILWVGAPFTANFRAERVIASIALGPVVAWIVDSFGKLGALPGFVASVAPITAALIVAAGSLAITVLRPTGTRWPREVGVAVVAIPALVAAIVARTESTWLALVIGGVTALLVAASSDGVFGSRSARKHLGWLALALATAGLWWRLGNDSVSDLEPYVLPVAGALLVVALLVWRAALNATPPSASAGAPIIALGALLVALLPLAAQSSTDPVTRAVAIGAVSAGLLLAGSFIRSTSGLRPYLDAAALAGAVGVLVAGFGRPLAIAIAGRADDTALDVWLAATLVVLLVAAVGQSLVRDETSRRWRAIAAQALGALAMVTVVVVELAVIRDGALGAARAIAVLVVMGLIHIAGIVVDRVPFSRVLAWLGIGLAALVGIVEVARDAIDPVEIATLIVAAALLVAGAVAMRRNPTATSWAWLAPGLGVLLLPSLLATFTDQPAWRLVGLGVACIVAILVGAILKLQAPLIIGAVIVLIHAIRTFAPQLVAVYQLTEWWVWAVVGGAIIIFVAVSFERRMRDLRSMGTRIAALR